MVEEKGNILGKPFAMVKYTYPKKIHGSTDAYLDLIKNWDDAEMHLFKQYKALLLDNDDQILAKITFPREFKFTVKLISSILNKIFDIAKANGATQIIIGQNSTLENVLPTRTEKDMALAIKKISESEHIPVSDQIILSGSSYYSFKKNGL